MIKQTPLPLNSILVGNRGSYKITSLVGRGGFGVTYSAEASGQGHGLPPRVAIKEFFPREMCERIPGQTDLVITDPAKIDMIGRLRNRFIKESRNLAACHTPSVVKVFDTFEANGTAYVVMELIDGVTLKEYMKARDNEPMKPDDARRLILQAAEALEYLHAKKINHLDIKPANMMVTPDLKRLVLIDFGLSRQYNSDGSTDSEIVAAVSKGYASPEQYAGVKRFSPESDIYSLGATYYKLITGQTPPEPFDLGDDPSLLVFPADIPRRDVEAIKVAMEPERNRRLGSAEEFIKKLTDSGNIREDKPQDLTERDKSEGINAIGVILNIVLGGLIASGLYVSYLILIKRAGKVAYEFYLGYDIYEVSKAGFAACILSGVGIAMLSLKVGRTGQKLFMTLIAAALIVSQIYYSI